MSNPIAARLEKYSTDKLLEMLPILDKKKDPDADAVLDAVFFVLESRLPEAKFIALCDQY